MSLWQRFRSLSPPERKRLLRLFRYIIRAEVILSFLPYSMARKLVFNPPKNRRPAPLEPMETLRCHLRLLGKINRHAPWSITCLRQAVGLRDALAAEGVASHIKIGLSHIKDNYEAHAWVECCGLEVLKNGSYSELKLAKGEINNGE